jgi:hypothetical protein
MEYDEQTGCHRIRERIWQEGNLVKDEVKRFVNLRKHNRFIMSRLY